MRMILTLIFVGVAGIALSQTMQSTHLRCEYLENPLGIDATVPRLSWWCESKARGDVQTGYQILAASSEELLRQNKGDLWDSGQVASHQSNQVEYSGTPLKSRMEVWWKVRLWDKGSKPSVYSKASRWSMGLLQKKDWKARWVGLETADPDPTKPLPGGPAPYVRHAFEIKKPVARAFVYASAQGLYNPFLDGTRVGNDAFDPGWTDYPKRIQYQTFDVTSRLTHGRHAIGAVLGDGWYCGHVGWGERNQYGRQPWGLVQLEIFYADGSTETIASSDDWKVSTGPILASDLLMGERYDAEKELGDWSKAGYDDSTWAKPVTKAVGSVPLVAQNSEPVKVWHELPAKGVTEPEPGHFVFDLGQNMVGWARIKVSGKAGSTIHLRFAEMLNPDGTIYITNLRKAAATDVYTLKGTGAEVYEPSFTFHGFRYVEVTGLSSKPEKEMVTGIVAGSAMPVTGSFECSNEMVNQLQHNIYWGQRGNYVSVPTDCPQRDERLGWMGDAETFIKTATFNCEVAGFMTKWLTDVRDGQSKGGAFADVSPRIFVPDGSPAWGDAGVIVPWNVYLAYGDRRLLEENYDAMKKWVGYILAENPDGIWRKRRNNDYGDWLSIKADTPKEVLATAFLAHSTDLVARSAAALGKTEDAETYRRLFEKIRSAFNTEYVAADGRIHGDTQTCYAMALGFDLLPDSMRKAAADHLVNNIEEEHGGNLSTGFVGVKLLAPVLTDAGRLDVAYRLLLNDTFPSWGYSIKRGATTIWERWDGWTSEHGFQDPGMNSFNHYALGSIGEWMYSVPGGIRLDPDSPGFKHFILRPEPGGGLTWVRCHYDSMYGRIECNWKREGPNTTLEVTVPANTTADFYAPQATGEIMEGESPANKAPGVEFVGMEDGAAHYRLGSGSYRFTYSGKRTS